MAHSSTSIGLAPAVVANSWSYSMDINWNNDLDSCVCETCMQLDSSGSEAVHMVSYWQKLTESLNIRIIMMMYWSRHGFTTQTPFFYAPRFRGILFLRTEGAKIIN